MYVRVLAPPYRAAGKGRLRVVRAEDKGDAIELVLTYDDFERLDRPTPVPTGPVPKKQS